MSRSNAPKGGAHLGRVEALDGGDAVVRFLRSDMCAHCGGCLAVGEKEMEARVKNTLHAQAGDLVEVTIAAKNLVLASVLAYCVPLALLIAGLYFGSLISEAVSAVLGIALCAGGFVLLRILEPRLRARQGFLPRMRAVLGKETTDDGTE